MEQVDRKALQAGAKSVKTLTNIWQGFAPEQLDASLIDGQAEQIELTDLDGESVCIFGFCKKPGKDNKDFLVICLTYEGKEKPVVVVTGAQVIVKKLEQIATANAFPVTGTFQQKSGKTGRKYFDLI